MNCYSQFKPESAQHGLQATGLRARSSRESQRPAPRLNLALGGMPIVVSPHMPDGYVAIIHNGEIVGSYRVGPGATADGKTGNDMTGGYNECV